jgi:ribonuclease PH
MIQKKPLLDCVAAVSVGVVDGKPMLDLCYTEDFDAEVDMNIVMTGKGGFVEVQGTAESRPFGQEALDELIRLARKGIEELVGFQKAELRSELKDVC